MQLRQLPLLPIIFVVMLIFLQYRLWFDSDGLIQMHHLKKQLSLQIQDNATLKLRNEDLLNEIHALQTNQDAMESHARQELGMIKKDETFYQVIN